MSDSHHYTPLHRVLLTLGISLFLFFVPLFSIVQKEHAKLQSEYSDLRNTSEPIFAQLVEHTTVAKGQRSIDLYTYLVPDEMGKMHEVTEKVDPELDRKLRVGDTVAVRRRTIEIFGKTKMISYIEENKIGPKTFDFLVLFSKMGVLFSFLVLITGGVSWRFRGRVARTGIDLPGP